ncbi:MAG: YlbF family regulator [Ruminiclostridium sp.]
MDAIKAARELGKAIQADPRYKEYVAAKEANDKDEELQRLIGEFNLKRQNLQMEMHKPQEEQNEEKLQKFNKEMQECYNDVMKNVNMANFTIVKNAVDQLLNEINMIIAMCCEGEDPDTCDPHAHGSCSGSCSTCGGCH